MNLKEIAKEWLIANGYDGLYGDSCGCELADLMSCYDWMDQNCSAGYKVSCPGPEDCPADGDCPWHIQELKPEKAFGEQRDE